jgi:heme A synthase
MTFVIGAICVQGAIGMWQYWTGVPAELVWFHVAAATSTWLCLLWAAAAGGQSHGGAQAHGRGRRPAGAASRGGGSKSGPGGSALTRR